MLVLTRYIGQAIKVGPARVRVVRVTPTRHGYKVRLGVEAPQKVKVLREELAERDGEHSDDARR